MCYQDSPVHTETLPNGFKIEIWHDEDGVNPVKDYDLPGEYYLFEHGTYGSLLDTNTSYSPKKGELAYQIKESRYPLVIAFRHGQYTRMYGRRINWYEAPEYVIVEKYDGFLVMDKKTITAEWGTKKTKVDGKYYTPTQMAERYALAELKVIGDYYDGNVYGYKVINPKGEEIEACWGYIGDYDGDVLEEAKSVAEHAAKKAAEGKAAKKAKKAEAKQFVQMFFHL